MKKWITLILFLMSLVSCNSDPCHDFVVYVHKIQADPNYINYTFSVDNLSSKNNPYWEKGNVCGITGLPLNTANQYTICKISQSGNVNSKLNWIDVITIEMVEMKNEENAIVVENRLKYELAKSSFNTSLSIIARKKNYVIYYLHQTPTLSEKQIKEDSEIFANNHVNNEPSIKEILKENQKKFEQHLIINNDLKSFRDHIFSLIDINLSATE